MTNHARRVVFFDLDGTLHQQDMFGSFLRYLLRRQPLNALLVLPLLPVIVGALLIKGRAARWPMSLLLWGCTFGHSEARLQDKHADFVRWFRQNVTAFPQVQERLTTYLLSSDADIWLITGSIAVEFGRKTLYSSERPSFIELEEHVRAVKNPNQQQTTEGA